MKLDTSTWKEFCIGDLFTVKRGKRIVRERDYIKQKTEEYPYSVITATKQNNGTDGYYHSYNCPKNSLVCGGEVSGMFTTYQPNECWVMDSARIFIPINNAIVNVYTAMFLATIFSQNQYKYSFGRKSNPDGIEKTIIKLPVTSKGFPDWVYMEQYIKSLHYRPITTKVISQLYKKLNLSEWREFLLGDLFAFYKGKRLTKQDMIEGHVNFLGAISENNGVRQLIDIEPIYKPNCITINYNGSVGEAFYQSSPFWASDDVNVLYAKDWTLNKYIALFIATVIKANRYKFSFGRKWTLDKMKESPIKLPITAKGEPDWDYMEKYIKSLPYSDRI